MASLDISGQWPVFEQEPHRNGRSLSCCQSARLAGIGIVRLGSLTRNVSTCGCGPGASSSRRRARRSRHGPARPTAASLALGHHDVRVLGGCVHGPLVPQSVGDQYAKSYRLRHPHVDRGVADGETFASLESASFELGPRCGDLAHAARHEMVRVDFVDAHQASLERVDDAVVQQIIGSSSSPRTPRTLATFTLPRRTCVASRCRWYGTWSSMRSGNASRRLERACPP